MCEICPDNLEGTNMPYNSSTHFTYLNPPLEIPGYAPVAGSKLFLFATICMSKSISDLALKK